MAVDDTLLAAVQQAEAADLDERLVLLCFLAARDLTPALPELNAALRRSELLLAAGGDPHRPLELYGRAVTALAEDLDEPERRRQLAAGLASLVPVAERFTRTAEALDLLRQDDDLAWQCYAMALLAESLADGE